MSDTLNRHRCWLYVMVVAMGISAIPSSAFLIQSTAAGDGSVVQASWHIDDVGFLIDAAGSADLGATQTARILRESFAVWQAVDGSYLRFVDEGLSTDRAPSRRDRRNLLVFDETGDILGAPVGSGIIAVTRINSDAATGEIFDADIVFNGRDFRFSAEAAANRIVLRDVAVHEIGHFIGLDHTPLGGTPAIRPTMNPFYFGDGPGAAASLAADDMTGIRVLYPTSQFSRDSGSISGRIADLDGQAVFGAHVTAMNLLTGQFYSTLSGADTGQRDAGAYTLHGLPAGQYRIAIEPVGDGLDESNFSGIFAGLQTDFPAEYHGNTAEATAAIPVTVPAGGAPESIDFITGFITPGQPYVRLVDGPGNTPDLLGPYEVLFDVLFAASVEVETDIDGLVSRGTAESLGDGMFRTRIPGQPAGSQVRYRITAVSADGVRVPFPADNSWLDFDVISLSGSPLAFAVLRDAGVLGVYDTGAGVEIADVEIARVDVGDDPIQILPSRDGDLLFVSNLGSSEITIIDASTFRVTDRILVAAQPLDMALSPDGDILYVSNSGASLLTAIDVNTRKVLHFVTVGALASGPFGIATSRDRVYVTDLNANQVLVVADGRVLSRISVPGGPRSLATSADRSRLYVTGFNAGTLTVINTTTDAVIRQIPLPVAGVFAVAIAPDDAHAFVTAHAEGVVLVVDLATHQVVDTIPVGADPRGLSFSPDGQRLYVTTSSSDEIYVFDSNTRAPIGTFAAAGGPRGISVVQAPLPARVTAVTEQDATPAAASLSALYPNPFNPETHVALSLSEPGQIQLEVFNALGQRVRHRTFSDRQPGMHVLSWDGRNDAGAEAASGVYVLVVRWTDSGIGGLATRRGVLLR